MSNTVINIKDNGTTTLATSGKYCDRNIDVVVNVAGGGGGGASLPTEMTVNGERLNLSGGWDWYFEAVPSATITATMSLEEAFYGSKVTDLSHIHINTIMNGINTNYVFADCYNLTALPEITWNSNTSGNGYIGFLFSNCWRLRNIPKDFFKAAENKFIFRDNSTSSGTAGANIFAGCYSLRQLPDLPKTINYRNPQNVYEDCYCLDEIINTPVNVYELTSDKFSDYFSNCHRAKDITFAVQDDGTPFTVKWKNQVIDLQTVGYVNANYVSRVYDYNSGITADKLVNSAADYEALKDDPDWYAKYDTYSRYNRLSAGRTLESLPDTSAYGTNTIKFTGAMGKYTGGEIKYLPESDIAAAAAKGWTVTIV
jgi:hypothetical protein